MAGEFNLEERNFYVFARGSLIECISILDLLFVEQTITVDQRTYFYSRAEEISKVLYKMIGNLKNSPGPGK